MKGGALVVGAIILLGILQFLGGPSPLGAVTPPAAHADSVWWVGAESTDSSALPNAGVRGTMNVISYAVTGCLSFWVADDLANGVWGQVGYMICDGSSPVAFYQVWSLGNSTVLAGGSDTVATGTHTFSMSLQAGTTWGFSLDGASLGTFNMGASVSSSTYPVQALSEEQGGSVFAFPQVSLFPALQVLKSGSWGTVSGATSYGTAWGVEGAVQNGGLPQDEAIVGGNLPALPQGTPLWGSVSTTSTTSITSLPPVTTTTTALSTVTSTLSTTMTTTVTSHATTTSTLTVTQPVSTTLTTTTTSTKTLTTTTVGPGTTTQALTTTTVFSTASTTLRTTSTQYYTSTVTSTTTAQGGSTTTLASTVTLAGQTTTVTIVSGSVSTTTLTVTRATIATLTVTAPTTTVTKEATTTASATLTKYITGTESTSNQKTTQEHNNEAPNAEAGGSPGLLPQTSLGLVLVVSSVGLGTLVIISKRVLTRSRGHPQGTDEYETH